MNPTVPSEKFHYWKWESYYKPKYVSKLNRFIVKNLRAGEGRDAAAVGTKGEKKKYVKARYISYQKLRPLLYPLPHDIEWINQKQFGVDLYPINLRSFCNYNVYYSSTEDHYDWHVDGTSNLMDDMKFTVVINLSDGPYTGGDFQIYHNDLYEVSFKSGDVLMFRSFLNHKITPLLSGERKTLVFFLYGPRWR